MTASVAKNVVPWCLVVLGLLLLPHVFASNSTVTIMNQMAITVVFALSYNMLLGQAGMLSFGHAVYMGVGGFFCLHVLNFVAAGDLPVPLPVLPLFAGLFSLGVATVVGAFSTRRGGTGFAMISLGIVELVASFSIIIVAFFGYGGAGGDRTTVAPFLGVDFAQQREVYYLITGWLVLSVLMMYLYTLTPLGRMANAVRDNPERVEFLGYSARWVRFASFCGAGFFAGVAGGLSAINYEIATAENLTVEASGTILLVAFLGGVGVFAGPIIGAVVFTLLQTVLSFETELWQLYVGVLFLATVMYFPTGLAGVLLLHQPLLRDGRWRRVALPYVRVVLAGIVALVGLVGLVEMVFHLRGAAVGESEMGLWWMWVDTHALWPWLICAGLALCGSVAVRTWNPALQDAWADAVRVE